MSDVESSSASSKDLPTEKSSLGDLPPLPPSEASSSNEKPASSSVPKLPPLGEPKKGSPRELRPTIQQVKENSTTYIYTNSLLSNSKFQIFILLLQTGE